MDVKIPRDTARRNLRVSYLNSKNSPILIAVNSWTYKTSPMRK